MAIIHQEHTLSDIQDLVFAELRKGAVQKKHPFRNVVLSTVSNNQAYSRWVVYRTFTAQEHVLIHTDARSEKVSHLKDNPHCSLLFYHNRHGLQIRLSGTVELHAKNDLTAKYWPGVKGSRVKSYTSLEAPGTPIKSSADGYTYQDPTTDEYFMIIAFTPVHIDVLQLERSGHIRAEFNKAGDRWEGTFLVP